MRHKLFFSSEALAALAAIPSRRRIALFKLMDALTIFPFEGEELLGEGRKEPTYARWFGDWRIVWWVDVPVFEIQVLLVERARR